MKKTLIFFIFVAFVFSVSCNKVEFPKDVPISIKNVINKDRDKISSVNEYKYKNKENIYYFIYKSYSYMIFDKHRNLIRRGGDVIYGVRGPSEEEIQEMQKFERYFEDNTEFIRQIYPYN